MVTTEGLYSLSALGWILIVVVAINTLLSLYYYMRIVVRIALVDDDRPALPAPLSGLALVNICGVALLVLTFLTPSLKNVSDRFARGMYDFVAAAPSERPAVAAATPDSK